MLKSSICLSRHSNFGIAQSSSWRRDAVHSHLFLVLLELYIAMLIQKKVSTNCTAKINYTAPSLAAGYGWRNLHMLITAYQYSTIRNGAAAFITTPLIRDLKNLTVAQVIVKTISVFLKIRIFIAVVITADHWPLFWTCSIQSRASHPISFTSVLILSSYKLLVLPSGFFHWRFPANICTHFFPNP